MSLLRILFCGILLRNNYLYSLPHTSRPSVDVIILSNPGMKYDEERNIGNSALYVISNATTLTSITTAVLNEKLFFPDKSDTNNNMGDIEDWDGTQYNVKKCSPSNGEIFFYGKCYKILSQGPCPDNRWWIILDKSGVPECSFRQCPSGQLMYHGNCVNVTSHDMCPINEILYVGYSGSVYCDCEEFFIYNKNIGQCVREHVKGTCPDGEYIELNDNGTILCKKSNCTIDTRVFNSIDGKCYNKTYIGRCNVEGGYDLLFSNTKGASCNSNIVITTRNVYEVAVIDGCRTGSKSADLYKCTEVHLNQRNNSYFLGVPTQLISNGVSCPTGYKKYPNNSCQKPNSLFAK